MQEMDDARENGYGDNFDRVWSDDRGDEAVVRQIVFDKGGVGRQNGLQFFKGEIRRSL